MKIKGSTVALGLGAGSLLLLAFGVKGSGAKAAPRDPHDGSHAGVTPPASGNQALSPQDRTDAANADKAFDAVLAAAVAAASSAGAGGAIAGAAGAGSVRVAWSGQSEAQKAAIWRGAFGPDGSAIVAAGAQGAKDYQAASKDDFKGVA